MMTRRKFHHHMQANNIAMHAWTQASTIKEWMQAQLATVAVWPSAYQLL
jgi:hypothetical protein